MVASSPSSETYLLTRQMPPAPLTINNVPMSSTFVDSERLDSQRRARQTCATPPARPRKADADLLADHAAGRAERGDPHQPAAIQRRFTVKSSAVRLSDGTGIAVTDSCVLSVNA